MNVVDFDEFEDKDELDFLDLTSVPERVKPGPKKKPVEHIDAEYLIMPWRHQLEAIEKARLLNNFALFMEMGTGKTLTMINILRNKFLQNGHVLKTIIFCPPIVVQNWKREWRFNSRLTNKVFTLTGSKQERLTKFSRIRKQIGEDVIIITNYESLLMDSLFEMFFLWNPEAIVFDESHKIKNIGAKRTKLAIKLADAAKYHFIMTGTPLLNTLLDLFTQFRALDGGQTFGKSYYGFRAHYFSDANVNMPRHCYFPNWKVKEDLIPYVQKKIDQISIRVKKEECLDLPPLVKKICFTPLSKEQARVYESMKKDFIAAIAGKGIAATNLAITKALRLQQIVSGFIPVEDEHGKKTNVVFKDNPRARALVDLLEEITGQGAKVIVWAVFKENYQIIADVCRGLKLNFVEVHGAVSPEGKNEAVDKFSADPTVSVLIGNPQSAGIGINLVCASYSIFYSRSFSLEEDLQAEARNYRGGSEIHQKITRIDLVSKGTIDELIAQKLKQKIAIGEAVLAKLAVEVAEGKPRVE